MVFGTLTSRFTNILKTKLINKFKTYKLSKLYHKIKKSIEIFNQMPMASNFGARPYELYANEICKYGLKEKLDNEISDRKKCRPALNKYCFRQNLCLSI